MVTWVGSQIMTSGGVRIIGFSGYVFCCTFDHVSTQIVIGLMVLLFLGVGVLCVGVVRFRPQCEEDDLSSGHDVLLLLLRLTKMMKFACSHSKNGVEKSGYVPGNAAAGKHVLSDMHLHLVIVFRHVVL
jgi:hypothetical protein